MSAVVVPFPVAAMGVDDVDRSTASRCSREEYDPDWWFDPASYNRAITICRRCPQRSACLDIALRNGERLGVWGGLTPEQRAARPDAVVIRLDGFRRRR